MLHELKCILCLTSECTQYNLCLFEIVVQVTFNFRLLIYVAMCAHKRTNKILKILEFASFLFRCS